jgi:hypothetical protein
MTSRRSVLTAILTGAGIASVAEIAKARSKHQRKRNARVKAQVLAGLRACPKEKIGPGQNLSKCDFSGEDLRGKNLRGANLSGAVAEDANLCGADLRATNLYKTDFTFANLTRVDFRGVNLSTAKLNGALFCQTRMPNGSINNDDCPTGTTICCFNSECPFDNLCVNGGCAANADCLDGQIKLLNGSCGVPCNDDGDCAVGCNCPQTLEHPSVCMNETDFTGVCANHGTSLECPLGSGCDRTICRPLCVPAD